MSGVATAVAVTSAVVGAGMAYKGASDAKKANKQVQAAMAQAPTVPNLDNAATYKETDKAAMAARSAAGKGMDANILTSTQGVKEDDNKTSKILLGS